MASEETYLAVLKASYDYDPQPDAEDEIAVKENQVLFLLEKTDEEWWKVKVKTESQDEDGPSGLVPAAYVEPAQHASVVKALYDYEPTQPSELSVKEDDILYVFDRDDDWLLVQKHDDDSRVGYVPGNYVEETDEDGAGAHDATPSAGPSFSDIVIPPSPPRPVSVYVDPADRVASNKAQADDIKTWSVSEIDKKGKKKKGTLGIGNGAVFFASESDKTPVQKWQTSEILSSKIDKSKHVYIDIGGSSAINLHFNAGSKDVAEAIHTKLESSRAIATSSSTPSSSQAPPVAEEPIERPRSVVKSVHFDSASPVVIPAEEEQEEPEEPPEEEESEPDHTYNESGVLHSEDGDSAVALYDFTADGEDELTVHEGEPLIVLERDTDEWWKCRNADGAEGVVPASYIEVVGGDSNGSSHTAAEDTAAIVAAQAASEAAKRAAAERASAEEEKRERERAEKQRKSDAEQRAKAAAAAAEADRKKRELERQKQAERQKALAAAAEDDARKPKKPKADSSRGSIDKRPPPTDNVRLWHDRTGQFQVHAAFLGVHDGKLRLHKTNGVVIEVPSEKMSPDDLKYVDKLINKSRKSDEDDVPLAQRQQSLMTGAAVARPRSASRASPPKKGPTIDWFEFFLNAGCDVDDCSRYATSFERDKMDESILPDITESVLRSLGLREGDIIRVKKAIESRSPKSSEDSKKEQLKRDEELAKQLQAEEDGGAKRGPAPNLFAGPNGALKTNVRRGRPQTSTNSRLPTTVDLNSLSSASDQIQRSTTPLVASPTSTTSPVNAPPRASSAAPVVSGFEDDAWTNRPSSTKPMTPTPAPSAATPRAPSAPPAPPAPPAPAPAPIVQTQSLPNAASPPVAPTPPQPTGSGLAKTTESDIFDQLARLSQLRVASPAAPQPQSASIVSPPPAGFRSGMGMGPSPVPMGQHLQAQQTGMLPPVQSPPINGPRGPYAPVLANQGLLQPLVPTNTGLTGFVPTRPQSTPSTLQPQPSFQSQPSFLSSQPTGFQPQPTGFQMQPTGFQPQPTGFQPQPTGFQPQPTGFQSQPMLQTGFPNSGPLLSQPTGFNGAYGNNFGGAPSPIPPVPPIPPMPTNSFSPIQSSFNPGFGQGPFSAPPPVPSQPAPTNTNPANIFAQMKSGTFASDNSSAPQGSDKYDALRPNPIQLTAQPTGWVYGVQGGYGFQH
ncbi:hypothetical protein C8Q75DRAFT_802490 [Abortiporus biennis]|nr:hypothetical protein C8Q75DRAFT_802490 [Abortiporus biennis]